MVGLKGALFHARAAVLFAQMGLIRLGPAPTPHFMATKLLPVVLCSAGALYFGNVAYLSLSVAFIQIMKVRSAFMVLSS